MSLAVPSSPIPLCAAALVFGSFNPDVGRSSVLARARAPSPYLRGFRGWVVFFAGGSPPIPLPTAVRLFVFCWGGPASSKMPVSVSLTR